MRTSENCENLLQIRAAIDHIDIQIIELIVQRAAYVKAAAKFKTNDVSVRAPERVQSMLAQRRAWATEKQFNPDVIAEMFQLLVNHFISEEFKEWRET